MTSILRVDRADVARMERAIRGARFEKFATPACADADEAAVRILRLYFETWVEAKIGMAMLHVVGLRGQRWRVAAPAVPPKRLRVSHGDVLFLREALAAARFTRADDSDAFIAAAGVMRAHIETEIVAPLVETLEHITGNVGGFEATPPTYGRWVNQ